ncbi:hypothetical protein C7974DRAFT_444335 [Boeremia exigua]|uniref:uncharacterized protein n=1 Tax=Boeremia exigua TaxID=749465 RepID=UPI001E8D63A8|nr:uncharacterized protein C7974DRAFT_444335 [Boeremia exigua]KAH6614311.1 hypothetical protein C7974DRAFT_444335 [Boeremia exigua]
MQQSKPSYEAVSPRSYAPQLHHPASEHYSTSNAREFDAEFIDSSGGLDALQQYLGSSYEAHDTQANTWNQYETANSNIDAQGNYPQTGQSPNQYNNSVLRGANQAQTRGLIHAGRGRVAHQHVSGTSPYNPNCMSYSMADHRSVATPMSVSSAIPADSSEAHDTPYSPYRGLFTDTDKARDHRHMSTRFGRQPYIHPEDDPTIAQVEHNRDHEVGRIYHAMIRGERAQDNAGSIAMKRWVHGAHYKSDLVESFAHKVFDCLLTQVKEGFRGWHHNDYVDDDRKGEKEDREADCMARLDNMIDALEREKTICEDVVNSASQIRMFVNAPIAYAARKYQNRLGNSKRGRTKDAADPPPRPVKARRTGGRHRARSRTASDIPLSRDTTPQFHTPHSTAPPYYASPWSPALHPGSSPLYTSPGQPQRPQTRHAAATAPPTARPAPAIAPPTDPVQHSHPTQPPAQMLPTPLPPLPIPTPHAHLPSPSPYAPAPAASPAPWPSYVLADPGSHVDPSLPSSLFAPCAWTDGSGSMDTRFPTSQAGQTGTVSLADIETRCMQPGQPLEYRGTESAGRTFGAPRRTDVGMQSSSAGGLAPGCLATGCLASDAELINDGAMPDTPDPVAEFEALWNAQPGVQAFSFDGCAGGFGLQ